VNLTASPGIVFDLETSLGVYATNPKAALLQIAAAVLFCEVTTPGTCYIGLHATSVTGTWTLTLTFN
jgi:hypothetical protein